MSRETTRLARAAVHRALGEPARLAVVDALVVSDASPGELAARLDMPSNLLAHHLRVLEEAGVISRARSEADHRRSYVRLVPAALANLVPVAALPATRVVFVCTHNSARSQLAAALWTQRSAMPAASAGTHPARRLHRRAIATAKRHGLTLDPSRTAHVSDVLSTDDLVVAVCDRAHEELARPADRLHWSVPDPAQADTAAAFEAAYHDLAGRVGRLVTAVEHGSDTDSWRSP